MTEANNRVEIKKICVIMRALKRAFISKNNDSVCAFQNYYALIQIDGLFYVIKKNLNFMAFLFKYVTNPKMQLKFLDHILRKQV